MFTRRVGFLFLCGLLVGVFSFLTATPARAIPKDESDVLAEQRSAHQASLNTFILDGVVDADAYGRQLVEKLKQERSALEAEGGRITAIRIFWVSPDEHPSPKLEAVMRLVYLGMQRPGQPHRQVFEDYKLSPNEFQAAMDVAISDEHSAFVDRLVLSKAMLESMPGDVAPRPITVGDEEMSLTQRMFSRTKTQLMQALGVPNGFTIIDFFTWRRIPRGRQLVVNVLVAGIQSYFQYLAADHFLRDSLGEGFTPAMITATAWTLFFGVFSEASLAQRTQGVAYTRVKTTDPVTGQVGYRSGMGISRAFLVPMTIMHSLLVRVSNGIAGFGSAFGLGDLGQTAETSVKSTFTKSVWERAIQKLILRDELHRIERARQGRPVRRPSWLSSGFLLNKALGMVNSTAALIDQFGILPGLRSAMLVLGIGGSMVEIFYKERDRTNTAFKRLVRRMRGQDPDSHCEFLLQVEVQRPPGGSSGQVSTYRQEQR